MNSVAKIDPSLLIRYEAMCTAIAECERVDEVKEIRDKARALEVYARQAKNTDAERKALNIRLRAERRAGELLSQLARATPTEVARAGGFAKAAKSHERTQQKEASIVDEAPYTRAIDGIGITKQTAHRYQQLAAVPTETFEKALNDPVAHPAASRIVREARDPVPQIDRDALRIWGNARDFERQRDSSFPAATIFPLMTDTMQDDMRRLVSPIARYWKQFEEYLNGNA